ncbi:MAG: RNA polymerase sigma factor [Patescibacteria group bacterium]
MNKASLKEKFLIYKVRQNKDAESYGKLYDYYVDRIFRFILFKVAGFEIAEDLTSEVFLKTWEYINGTPKKIGNLNALLYKVARNCVIDYYRSKSREAICTDEECFENICDERNDLVEETADKIDIQSIEKHLSKLKDAYREVIILKYIEDFSVSEIAELIDKSNGTVRVLLHRAMKALKDIAGE